MAYDKITIYSPIVVDYIDIEKNTFTQAEYEATYAQTYAPSWGDNSVMVANFNTGINSDDSTGLTSIVKKWSVYRQKIGSSVQEKVISVDKDTLEAEDYLVSTNSSYRYRVYPETDTEIGVAIISDDTKTCWRNWVVLGLKKTSNDNIYSVDNNNVWLFDYNLQSSEISQSLNKNVYEGFTKFPKVSKGNRNYLTGNINCLIGKFINSKYYDSKDMIDRWTAFVNSGDKKILKDRKGNLYEIEITESSFKYEDVTSNQIVSISFKWIQIGDLSTIDYDVIAENETGDVLNYPDKQNYNGIWNDIEGWVDEFQWYD